ncbi:hypothetical protein M5689_012312 [Euphorbia peplus]|nr:hypothetical protein M5689_012312 [Euphorbia peplus]
MKACRAMRRNFLDEIRHTLAKLSAESRPPSPPPARKIDKESLGKSEPNPNPTLHEIPHTLAKLSAESRPPPPAREIDEESLGKSPSNPNSTLLKVIGESLLESIGEMLKKNDQK